MPVVTIVNVSPYRIRLVNNAWVFSNPKGSEGDGKAGLRCPYGTNGDDDSSYSKEESGCGMRL